MAEEFACCVCGKKLISGYYCKNSRSVFCAKCNVEKTCKFLMRNPNNNPECHHFKFPSVVLKDPNSPVEYKDR